MMPLPRMVEDPNELRKIAQSLIKLAESVRQEADALLRSAEKLDRSATDEQCRISHARLSFP
jgi:hypothetical protein